MKESKREFDWHIVCIGLIVLLIVVGSLYYSGFFWRWNHRTDEISVSLNNADSFQTKQDVEAALKRLDTAKEDDFSKIIDGYAASQRKVVLTFCGMGTAKEMQKIRELLNEYKVPATFFVTGMSATEDIELLELLKKDGHIIGNYGLSTEKNWEKIDKQDLVVNLSKSQSILNQVLGEQVKYVQPNSSKITKDVRLATHCAGINEIVEPTRYVSDSSFPSFSAALGFVEDIQNGSIISIKLDAPLTELEYEEMEVDERPAIDKQDTIQDHEKEEALEPDIVRVVEYLLEAFSTTEMAVVPLGNLYIEPDNEVDDMFLEQEFAKDFEIKSSSLAPSSYFNQALFIGDSLTQALYYYTNLKENSHFTAYKSITPKDFVNNVKAKNVSGEEVAILDHIYDLQPDKIYILLGTNALASGSDDSMLQYYGRLLELLKEKFPKIPIYVQGLPPVTKKVSSERISLTNGRIRKVNVKIAKMAKEKDCYYIDLYSALVDEEGNLKYSVANEDGIHFNQSGCNIWMNYLLEHTIENANKSDEKKLDNENK